MNLDLWASHAYSHESLISSEIPSDDRQRAIYGMLVAIDFECHKYGDAPEGTADEIKEWLLEHKEEALQVPPPTILGFFGGAFDFLTGAE